VTALDFLVMKGASVRGSRVVPHLLERPGQVDRGGTRSGEQGGGGVEILPTLRCERKSVRGRNANRGRAPNR